MPAHPNIPCHVLRCSSQNRNLPRRSRYASWFWKPENSNVLTAHSTREALDVFHLFPNVSAAVLVGCDEIDCGKIAKAIKTATEKVPVVLLPTRIGATCRDADHDLSSAEPEKLLELMRSLLGDPRHYTSASMPR